MEKKTSNKWRTRKPPRIQLCDTEYWNCLKTVFLFLRYLCSREQNFENMNECMNGLSISLFSLVINNLDSNKASF